MTDFSFDCYFGENVKTSVPCHVWREADGDKIVLQFSDKVWEQVDGDKVLLQFPKCKVDTPPDPTDFSFDFYHGENVNVELQETFAVNFYHGTSLSTDINTSPYLNVSLDFYFGDSASVAVQPQANFSIDAYSGEVCNVALTTIPIVYFTPNAYFGDTAQLDISTENTFSFDNYTGENVSVDIKTSEVISVQAIAYDGFSASSTITTSSGFSFNCYDGYSAQVDITIDPNVGFPFEVMGFGDSVSIDLNVSPGFVLSAYHGESVNATINTTNTFEFNSYEGHNVNVELTQSLPIYIAPTAYFGDVLTTDLTLPFTRFSAFNYFGDVASVELTTAPTQDFTFTAYYGESAEFYPFLNVNFENVVSYSGEVARVTIDNEPNYIGTFGENVTFDLATQTTITPFTMGFGEYCEVSVATSPSEPIGTVSCYFGDLGGGVLKTQPARNFAVLFRTSFVTQGDIDSTTSFDLTTDCCGGPQREIVGDVHNFELQTWEEPATRYDGGFKFKMDVDIQTLPRFSATAYSGSIATIKDYSVYFDDFNFYFGTGTEKSNLDMDVNSQLCRGNFIPDADNLTIELSVQEENCSGEPLFYFGESLETEIQNNVQMAPVFDDGFAASCFLTTYTPWNLTAYHGQQLIPYIALEISFDPLAYHGIMATVPSYEEKFEPNVSHGFSMEFDIVVERDVEFLESGCLPNEYIPVKESGDPDWDKFNPVPVEEDQYMHEIKARCL